MDYLQRIADWAVTTHAELFAGAFRVRSACGRLRSIAGATPPEERLAAYDAARRALEAAAFDAYRAGNMGRKLVPKLLLYHSFKYIMWSHRERGERLLYLIQWAYTYLAGRQLTPSGVIRFYFLVAAVLTLTFAFFYVGGLELTGTDPPPVRWFHYPYFSAVTLTTLGYGDIHPCNTFTMAVAAVQAFTGYLLLGLAVSTVVMFNTPVVLPPDAPNLLDVASDLRRQWEVRQAEHSPPAYPQRRAPTPSESAEK